MPAWTQTRWLAFLAALLFWSIPAQAAVDDLGDPPPSVSPPPVSAGPARQPTSPPPPASPPARPPSPVPAKPAASPSPPRTSAPPSDLDEPLPPSLAKPPAPAAPPALPPATTAPAKPAAVPPVKPVAPASPPTDDGPAAWPTAAPAEVGAAPVVDRAPRPGSATATTSWEEFCRHTKIGAWAEAQLFVDESSNTTGRLRWLTFSLEHRPLDWLRLVAAVQVEDGTHFGVQQALIEAAPLAAIGARAGLMVLPLGLGNLQPDPTAELSVDRPLTDQLIIPMIWREMGAGIFGQVIPELRYQGAVVSGLDGSGLSPVAPLWGGRGDGSNLAARDAAVTGRLELVDLPPGLVLGTAGYIGGASHGLAALSGVRVGVVEADLRYKRHGLNVRAEYARLYVVNSYLVNDYLGLLGQSAVPSRGRGYYVEIGYDILQLAGAVGKQALELFAGYENVNPRSGMSPYNYNPPAITMAGQLAPEAPSNARGFVRGGFDYRPRPSIVLKVDVQVALNSVGVPGAPLSVASGAPGVPRTLGADVMDAARGATRVGVALGFSF